MKGLVIKNTGSHYLVQTPENELKSCIIKGSFRIKGLRTTNPVAVGDEVEFNEAGLIVKIFPRKNYIIRRASNLSKEGHILAANIDQVALVMTLKHPVTSLVFIDRFLATAEAYSVKALIIINKCDLLNADEKEELEEIKRLYSSIGYEVLFVSAKNGEGVAQLKTKLEGKITLFSGNSGVGKSTLINALIPGANLSTAEISDVHDTGMHTTTFSEMFRVPGMENARIIDTPGIKGFGTLEFDIHSVGHYFPEIFIASSSCKYGNCTHTHEPGCNVIEAVKQGKISPLRYNSYLNILEDEKPDKYRSPF